VVWEGRPVRGVPIPIGQIPLPILDRYAEQEIDSINFRFPLITLLALTFNYYLRVFIIIFNINPPVLRTPERKSGAENAGQTYFRNSGKNPVNREKIIRKPSSNPWIHQH